MKLWALPAAVLAFAAVLVLVPGAPAQIIDSSQVYSRYSSYYGDPVDVELEEIARGIVGFQKRAVRTRGTFEAFGMTRDYYRLRDSGAEVVLVPTVEMRDSSQAMTLMGKEVEITGVVRRLPDRGTGGSCGQIDRESASDDPILPPLPLKCIDWPEMSITYWSISDITRDTTRKLEPNETTLEALVTRPGERDGQTLKVVGMFRGRNLYGDLPVRTQRNSSDWVIKDELFAVWVTGKKPKGSGWELDASLKRDTGRWIEVIGRPTTVNGVTYLRAIEVNITTAPSATARVEAPPPPPDKPKVPPVVVFALPLDGERDLPQDSRFVIQFSKDMNEESFNGKVVLRYAGPQLAGDRPFDGVKMTYEGGRRALTVDPGDLLRPGRAVEIVLLPGIKDVDGLELIPRPGRMVQDAVDMLRYQIEAPFLSSGR
jgi:hypothetical protein